MALRNLAARMRNPAAAALRLPPPALRFSPPAGARPRFYGSFQGRPASSDEDVKRLYQQNLAILEGVKKHEDYLKRRLLFLETGRKFLKLSFMLLMPIPAIGALLIVTTR
uniref:Uncharacterized protein n=1 Tax=Avena sativa TaxID=4498 RepID=A0ACD5Z930_AVESA